MTAVAVWGERPDAKSMLDARLLRGWKPTATAMLDGKRVLGFAACVLADRHPHRDSGS